MTPQLSLEQAGTTSRSVFRDWAPVIVLLAATLMAHSKTIPGLVGSWFDEHGDMGHGILVPFAVAYMVWDRRSELVRTKAQTSILGVVLVVLSAFAMLLGTAAQWT